ncbi:ribonuclease III [Mariprofundus micogutta]|uniref:Ribonuclease 3 n=1 Tax=Mariprofundus micogutta TaxID=1921010 RepID=A0A1L8CNU1_9PROT|nr:ribonuclease III [Mariprofundus micogutta]GAV20585.1 ribonuclease III [Mariprofundus micogutta]
MNASNKQAGLEAIIGYTFSDKGLLKRALTHRSMTEQHMERLEFLGDAVLGLAISEFLHHHFPELPEGKLSRMRSALVRKESLYEVALVWKLTGYLHVGESERVADGIKSPSIAANAVEAVIGAVFQDSGWEPARKLVLQAWQSMLQGIDQVDNRDAKSRLQELTQAQSWGLPEYELQDHGVGKNPRFEARCSVKGELMGVGFGERKKQAEIAAAEQAWQQLKT